MSEEETQLLSCQLISHKLPVTAVLLYDEHIVLAGEGRLLCLYSTADKRPFVTHEIFDDQAVHGIRRCSHSGQVVIFGGRYARILRFNGTASNDLSLVQRYTCAYTSPVYEAEDWILAASFSHGQVMLVTAHNALLHLKPEEQTSEGIISNSWQLEQAVAGSNTILYSADISPIDGVNAWLIAAGTAFGDIVLWSCRSKSGSETSNCYESSIHYSFSAHEGSVFGVAISPERLKGGIEDGPEQSRLLATCSDDRTVRVWNITDWQTAKNKEKSDHDTGFGGLVIEANRPQLVARVMDHGSRIWHVAFAARTEERPQTILRSYGEDTTTITWSLGPKSTTNTQYELRKLDTFSGNAGKHIWSQSSADVSLDKVAAIVGGSDGGIVQSPLLTLPYSGNTLLWANDQKKDNIRAYQFLDRQTLVATTSQGTIQIMNLNGDDRSVTQSFERAELSNYSIVECIDGLAFICGSGSRVYVYQKHVASLSYVDTDEGKISALFVHTIAIEERSTRVAVLTARATKSDLCLQIFDISQELISSVEQHTLRMPQAASAISTAWIEYADKKQALAVGVKTGHILVFLLDANKSGAPREACHTLTMHTEAVTAIRWVANSSASREGLLLSTSRDGTIAISELNYTSTLPRLQPLHRLELSIGTNLEGHAVTPEQDILAYGFSNKHFVVHSLREQDEFFTTDCGGAHRNWAVFTDGQGISFVWTQAGKLHYYSKPEREFIRYSHGGHGREIKATAVSRLAGYATLVATGAQDTDIKLWVVAEDGQLVCLHTLRKHNTGPQQLSFSDDGQYLFSSGGFEEFIVWRLVRDCPIFGVGVICESVHPRTGSSDLRINSFDARRQDDGTWTIAMTYSDSRVGIWSYNNGSWQTTAEADYLTFCPTTIAHLPRVRELRSAVTTETTANNNASYAVTATDGHVSVWSLDNSSLAWTARHQAHQSAILCSTGYRQGDSHIIVTGGDDNGLAFTRISPGSESVCLTIRRAHAAAVTAVQLYQEDKTTVLLSAGLDQRLVVWQLIHSDDTQSWLTARKLHVAKTGVADVSGLDLLSAQDDTIKILLTGVGTEVWTISLPSAA